MPDVVSCWRPAYGVDIALTLGGLQRGAGDPTQRLVPSAAWRTARTPLGPATVHLTRRVGVVEVAGWGPGAEWLVAAVPDLLGARDDPSGFKAAHPLLADAHRRHPGLRLPRTGLVLEALVPAVIEQLVTGAEAFRTWRELLRFFGEPAPGPTPEGMRVFPAVSTLLGMGPWHWHRIGLDGRRRTTVIAAARVAGALERLTALSVAEARRRLRTLAGVGPWTVAETLARALGDADAVPVGDFHLPSVVGRALTGRPVDDEGMLALLAPYQPQRYRAIRLLELAGGTRPRFGPRYPVRNNRSL